MTLIRINYIYTFFFILHLLLLYTKRKGWIQKSQSEIRRKLNHYWTKSMPMHAMVKFSKKILNKNASQEIWFLNLHPRKAIQRGQSGIRRRLNPPPSDQTGTYAHTGEIFRKSWTKIQTKGFNPLTYTQRKLLSLIWPTTLGVVD